MPLAWLFGGAAIDDRWLAFRDAANYYQPLFAWEGQQWAAGRIPLWNPADNCGTPAVADATSSVFYPGKLVFLLPIGFELRFHLYIVLHLALAAGAAFRLARGWDCSCEAAALAAVAYALGGNVLFQTCNVVFLVGAAWLPLAVLAADRLLRQGSPAAAVGLGVVLALMTLGGDPQAAYHVLLGAALYWAILRRSERKTRLAGTAAASRPPQPPSGARRLSLLSLAAGSGFLLAAVQILPSLVWTNASDRASFEQPRSLAEIVQRRFGQDGESAARRREEPAAASAIWGVPRAGSHHAQAYQFSVGPWRLAEYVWPNLYGSTFPKNRRWISALPGEGRVWTPSMYLGLLPLMLALGRFRLRAACPRQRWLSWSLLLSVLASFGWYGIGWLIHEARCGWGGAAGDDFLVGPQVGGVYWLMSTVLPGYVYFRYPAKLMILAALAASMLAATGWDRAWQQPTRLPNVLLALAGVSFALAALAVFLRTPFQTWVAGAPVDQLFGPLDAEGAYTGLRRALLHAALLSLAFSAFLRHATPAPASRRAAVFRRLTLAACVCEITLANGPLLVTVPGTTLRAPSRLASMIHADARMRGITATPRVFRDPTIHTPGGWQTAVAADRLTEVVAWEHETLLPKHHLTSGVAQVESFSTLSSRDFRILMQVARETGPRLSGAPAAPNRDVLNLLATRYFILSRGDDPGTGTAGTAAAGAAIGRGGDAAAAAIVPLHNPTCFPRAWIVHRAVRLRPLGSADPRVVADRTREVLRDRGATRDFAQIAVIESDASLELPEPQRGGGTVPADGNGSAVPADGDDAGEFCQVVSQTPQRVEVRCRLEDAGLVVVNDLFYTGWRALVRPPDQTESREVPILRANRVMRSVYLPAGEHVLELIYRPTEFYVGAAISIIAWLVVLAWWCARSVIKLLALSPPKGS